MYFLYHFLMVFDVLGWAHRARAARQAALLSMLAVATEKQLPLTAILDAFADDSRFGWRHAVRDLSDMKALLRDHSAQIIDARAPERFAGLGRHALDLTDE